MVLSLFSFFLLLYPFYYAANCKPLKIWQREEEEEEENINSFALFPPVLLFACILIFLRSFI
jgi:hypothetical protein